MNSKIIILSPIFKKIKKLSGVLYEDRLTVYAAQTSFYICVSAIPFIMLLLSLSRLVAPDYADSVLSVIRTFIPENSIELFDHVCAEIRDKADIPLISTAAATTLWSASRGVYAVTRGVSEVYKTRIRGFFIGNILLSLVYTLVFIAAIITTLFLLVFDSSVRHAIFSEGGLISYVMKYKGIIVFLVLTLFFSLLYHVVSKGVFFITSTREKSKSAPQGFISHLAGAVVAAAGWLLFSFFYSLYIKYFSRFSYIYGSLTAVVFLMFWLYFCIVILLVGAELNRFLWENKNNDACE